MKGFIYKIIVFISLLFIVDRLLGYGMGKLRSAAIGGNTEREEYIANKATEDILIFGSSRALDHYNPNILTELLGLSCYNCGQDESGIVLFYPRYKMMAKRNNPKIIIYDIYLQDLYGKDNEKYLSRLKPYYNDKDVKEMFSLVDHLSKYKMFSHIYQHNSTLYDVLKDNFINNHIFLKGFYSIMTGTLDYEPTGTKTKHEPLDSFKVSYLEKFIKETKDKCQLFFCISPVYKSTSNKDFDSIKILCKKYNIPLLNHYCDTLFTNHRELFSNVNHLNRNGADLYSEIIVNEIKNKLE